MTADARALDDTFEMLLSNPKEWNQTVWRCKTGMCFAGLAVVASGGKFMNLIPKGSPDDELVQADHLKGYPQETIAERAARVLNLSDQQTNELFDYTNSLPDLYTIINKLKAGEL